MDEDDRPRPSGAERQFGVASLLAGESLDPYSREELDTRIALLESEIARVKAHRDKSEAHRRAADQLFGSKS
jgi:uncharacterized small protein (DUF1192 family)